MDVRIGVTQTPKEIEVELGDDADGDQVVKDVEAALAGGKGMLWLTDRRGRRVGVPADKVAYVELGSPAEERRGGVSTRCGFADVRYRGNGASHARPSPPHAHLRHRHGRCRAADDREPPPPAGVVPG